MSLIEDFISLFFPHYCFTCQKALVQGERYICTHCIADLPKTEYHLHAENPIKSKLLNITTLQHGMSYVKFIKGGKIQKLLHRIKYANNPEIGETLGMWYGYDLRSANITFDMIVPIPLHPKKLKKRGYNQSDYFAAGLSKTLQIPWSNQVLTRNIDTSTQTRKSKVERWQNVEDIFVISQDQDLSNKHILLVDDVITTGSTLESCAMQLEKLDNVQISVATIAMAE